MPQHEVGNSSGPPTVSRRYWLATIAFTLWMLFWVPVVLSTYGPQNFLWLCNLAQFIFLYAAWTRNRLLASSQAGIMCFVGLIWTLDFSQALLSGGQTAVMTKYMFMDVLPLLARVSSLYHVFVPIFAIYLVYSLGYDRRGPWVETGIGTAAILATALFTDPARNVNWLVKPFEIEQVWVSQPVYVVLLLIAYPLLLFWPGHALVLAVLAFLNKRRVQRESAGE